MAGAAGNLSLSDGITPNRSHNCGSVGSVHLRNLLVGESLASKVSGMTANSIALLPISLLPLGEGLGMRAYDRRAKNLNV